MGEAKRKIELLRKQMLRQGELWSFPETAWETDQVKEVLRLPISKVRRLSRDEIAFMRMPENQCHGNARWYAKNDPTGQTRAISGWIIDWPNLILHSVVGANGSLICLTPSLLGGYEREFGFIPDQAIKWRGDDDYLTPWRNGQPIEIGLRVFPKVTERQCEIIRDRLENGMDPHDAINVGKEFFEELEQIVEEQYSKTYDGLNLRFSEFSPSQSFFEPVGNF